MSIAFLETLPLMGFLLVVALNWGQFLALLGLSSEAPRFDLTLRADPLPASYVTVALVSVLLFEILPYGEELLRGFRAQRKRR